MAYAEEILVGAALTKAFSCCLPENERGEAHRPLTDGI